MNESVKVSVIVPIYNVEKYIGKCILSIIEQTYKNIEIILVDDGSLDDSGNIADEYATRDNRIKVLHKTNSGVSAARNSGLDAATGDFVCFSDGDDYVMPNYVEHLLKLCLTYHADVAYTVDMYTTFHNEHIANSQVKVITPEDATENILCYKVPIGVYSKLFNREFLVKNNIRFLEDVYIGEGFNFNTACFQRANKVVMSNERIYFYRRDNENAMTSHFFSEKYILDYMKLVENIYDFCKKHKLEDEFYKKMVAHEYAQNSMRIRKSGSYSKFVACMNDKKFREGMKFADASQCTLFERLLFCMVKYKIYLPFVFWIW